MIKYVLKRLLQIIPVLLCVAIVIFTIMYFAPGDPVMLAIGDNYTPERYAEVAARMGLDKGYFGQLWDFLKSLFLHFDFGTSYILKTDIKTELFARLPRTALIASAACCRSLLRSPWALPPPPTRMVWWTGSASCLPWSASPCPASGWA